MRKAILIVALGAAVAQARPYNLDCREGNFQCPHADCVSIIFKNTAAGEIGEPVSYEVVGEIKAELTGAAKLASDGRYEIHKMIDKEIMSCWVPTGAFKNSVKTASLEMSSNGKSCNNYVD